MELFFHIGAEKTATTSTQEWFADNRALLRKQGVAYSQALGAVSHRSLCLWCLNPDKEDQGFLYNNVHSVEDRRRFRADLTVAFAKEVAAARADGCTAFVISNEHCHSRLTSHQEVARSLEFLEPHFDKITVLCALRPQVDMVVSLASTVSRDRWRVTRTFFDQANPNNPYYDFNKLVARWSAVYGAARVRLLAFRVWPTAAAWLIRELGLDPAGLPPIRRVNEALDIKTMAMVNALQIPIFNDSGRQNPFTNLFLDKLPTRERLSLGLDLAQAIQARFEASNADLVATRSDILAADLLPDWRSYDRAANIAMLDENCGFADQMIELVRIFNEHLLYQRIQTRIAHTERAIARGRRGNAENFLKDVRHMAETLMQAKSLVPEAEWINQKIPALAAAIRDLRPAPTDRVDPD